MIAKLSGISKNNLMKVPYQFGLAGYVETVRSKGGGLRLALRLRDIALGDVVRHTEPDIALVPCLASDDSLVAHAHSHAWRSSLQSWNDWFAATGALCGVDR